MTISGRVARSLVALFLLGGGLARAQSLEDTMQWIADVVKNHSVTPDPEARDFVSASGFKATGCSVEWRAFSSSWSREQDRSEDTDVSVRLGDLDPARATSSAVTFGGSQIVLWGRPGENPFRNVTKGSSISPVKALNREWQSETRVASGKLFITREQSYDQRFVSAVKHAIELCGGKTVKEPF